jgi:oxygen-independent coproporphyrinogen-3 oxidase
MATEEPDIMEARMDVDVDLVRKYDRPGPRYTSYPTAPHFHEGFARGEWLNHIRAANEEPGRPLSLYVHIPFCDSLCWFCGCNMLVERRKEPVQRYLDALYSEIAMYKEHLHPDREVVQVHFGGGTPTHLAPSQIREVGRVIHDSFAMSPDAEISVEIDPRNLTAEHISALRDAGFNRASVGIQDFDETVQRAVNRIHDAKLVGSVLDWIREAGFKSLNLDLIYGLPFQRTASFSDTLDQVLAFSPDRLAVFSYAHVPWIKVHQKLIKDDTLPAPEEKLAMLKLIVERLTGNGFEYIGMDHFARREDPLAQAQRAGTLQRNFQGYSTHAGTDIHAFGVSSISQLPRAYAQHCKSLTDYHKEIDAGCLPVARGIALTEEDAARRHIIMRLMCDMGLDFDRMSTDLALDFEETFGRELQSIEPFEQDGLLTRYPGGVSVTRAGRLFIRNIAMEFDTWLEGRDARYSRTV